jgi:polar amino acid transport system substrate-binding protein
VFHWVARCASVAVAGVLLLAPGLVQARTLDEILSSQKLVVGVNPTLPPLGNYNDKNEIVGFDVDLGQKLADMLGVKLEIIKVGSPDRVPFVASGKVDIVLGALTRNPERAKVVDFTVPIQTEALSVLTTAAKPFKSWKDLNSASVTLVQVRGTTPLEFIKANIPDAKLLLLDNYPDVVRALAQGRGDAMIDVVDYVGTFMKNYPTDWKILKEPIGSVDYDGIGVAKGNESLRGWLNVALYSLQTSGFIDTTYKKWFGIDMVVPIVPSPYF